MRHGPEPAIDFGKLNAAERTALDLLARGHTAKSIATLTGRSVGAVNERLREARRKTGIGSSRELARLLAAQKNRDELIGVSPEGADIPDAAPPTGTIRSWKGVTLMSIAMLGAIAALLAALPASQVAPAAPPAAERALLSDSPTPKQIHDRIMAEPRDTAWASETEAALDKWFAEQTEFAGVIGEVTVRCGKTTCEAFGSFASGVPEGRINAALATMQGKPFEDALRPLGMTGMGGSFGQGSFAVFASRRPA